MDQCAGIFVFEYPERTIGALFHIANAAAHIPALGGFRAAMPVKDNAVERLARLRRADAARPGFSRRQVGAGESISAHDFRGLGGFGVARWIDQRNSGSACFAEVGIAGGGFAVERQAQDLAFGLIWILGWGEALAVAHCEE